MATVREIEDQIAGLNKRHAELDGKLVRGGVVDGTVSNAMHLVDKQLRELQRRQASLLAGQPDPGDVAKTLPSATPPPLRAPRWITKKETRATADEVHAQNVETAKSLPLEISLQDLSGLYATEAHIALTETMLRAYTTDIVQNGRVCQFDEGLYAGFLGMLFDLSVTIDTTNHFAGNQRRLLEQRVEALESRRQDPPSALQIQLMEHKLTPLFQVEFANAVAPLIERIGALEQQRDAMKYCGVWSAGRQYEMGNFVTDRGSVWHCNSITRQRPGEGCKEWTLAVKRGANADKDNKHG